MIVVIADDLTGAAEIGGIGLRYQMKVEIEMKLNLDSDADLLIIATDIRSQTVASAKSQIKLIAQRIKKLEKQPEFIFIKIDSVLRGHILTELQVLLEELDKRVALLVPANPHLGRTIKEGIYFINGNKLHESEFKDDPQFSSHTSSVKDLVEGETSAIISIPPSDEIPSEGMVLGEASSEKDMELWSKKVQNYVIPSGASGFFSAILREKGLGLSTNLIDSISGMGEKRLFVCGSAFPSSKNLVRSAIAKKKAVSLIPSALTKTTAVASSVAFQSWIDEILSLLKDKNSVILATHPDSMFPRKEQPDILKMNMAIAVQYLLKESELQELLIEGGATAFTILNRLGVSRAYPVQELSNGVIRMALPHNKNLHITLKPGSYDWPDLLKPV
ncbi:MAG TPA: four-carbon acid sugar kinase family protein [Chitinophagaceae bacterium]|nr:four-carbon acid sugar kinase family protein [Chitinophagaceae bacterium]